MARESLSKCVACNGTGDRGREFHRGHPLFQQCSDCAGEGMTLDLTEVRHSLESGKLRLEASGGKYKIDGDEVTVRMFRAAFAEALMYWVYSEPAQPKPTPKKTREAEGDADNGE